MSSRDADSATAHIGISKSDFQVTGQRFQIAEIPILERGVRSRISIGLWNGIEAFETNCERQAEVAHVNLS